MKGILTVFLFSLTLMTTTVPATVTMTTVTGEWWTFQAPTADNSIVWVDIQISLESDTAQHLEQAERWLKTQFREMIPELATSWHSQDLPSRQELNDTIFNEVTNRDLTSSLAAQFPDTNFELVRTNFYDCH
jgi:hypothetical protein